MSDFDRNASTRWGQGVTRAGRAEIDQGLRSYMLGVYNNMVVGLALTGAVALGVHMLAVTTDPAQAAGHFRHLLLTSFGVTLYASPLKWVVMLAPLAFVLFFSIRINQISAATARIVFLSFAASIGLSLSTILLVYTGTSVANAFFVTAAAFGGLSLYGYTTRRDLAPMGAFMVMGLFGLVIAMLVNLFLQSTGFQFALSNSVCPDLFRPHRLGHAIDQGNVLCERRLRGRDEEIRVWRLEALSGFHQHLSVAPVPDR